MTREECKKQICEKVKEIWGIYKQYNPKGQSLGMYSNSSGLVMINDEYWKDDVNKPLTRAFERIKRDD